MTKEVSNLRVKKLFSSRKKVQFEEPDLTKNAFNSSKPALHFDPSTNKLEEIGLSSSDDEWSGKKKKKKSKKSKKSKVISEDKLL